MRIFILCLAISLLSAGDCIRSVRIADLKITEGQPPAADARCEVAISSGEAYIDVAGAQRAIALRIPAIADVRGVIAVYEDNKPARRVAFTIPASVLSAGQDATVLFRAGQRAWCNQQLAVQRTHREVVPQSNDRGTRAWWSYIRTQAGGPADARSDNRWGRRGEDLSESMDLFTGTTALSDNLQFDRALRISGEGEPSVSLSSLPGITTQAVAWDFLIDPNAKVELDNLAACIPADQHAVLFPSFDALATSLTRMDGLLAAPLLAVSGTSSDAGAQRRYQTQLGLEMSELAKRFGAQVVNQVAITGSDPFLRAGSDLALVFRAKQPALLAAYLQTRLDMLVKSGAKPVEGKTSVFSWRGAVSDDRALSSYVLVDGEVAVVTNSLAQINAYAAVHDDPKKALNRARELTFFRQRYPLGAANENTFVILSDATIRRWCSARWRIADSRRTRAATLLCALQAEWIAAGAKPDWKPTLPPTDLGTVTVDRSGVRSSIYGSLNFLTPIAELSFQTVTEAEANAYRQFHSGYQWRWRGFFDPIAVQLNQTAAGGVSVDVSILPLISDNGYGEIIRLVGDANLKAARGDRHDALIQWTMALDHQGRMFTRANHEFGPMLGNIASPLGWVGNSLSLYADRDPFWQEWAETGEHEHHNFIEKNLKRLPVGLQVDVADPLNLAVFLTALRGTSDQAAAGLVEWQSRTYKDIPYVMIEPTAQSRGMLGNTDAHLGYVALPEGLTVSLNEDVIKRAIDRVVDARAGSTPAAEWPGQQAVCSADPGAISALIGIAEAGGMRGWLQRHAWAHIAILNEWKRRFPTEDPVAVHERLWGNRLVCPGGGTYVWNEQWLTMESTVYGHPAAPKEGAHMPIEFQRIGRLNAGLDFAMLPPNRIHDQSFGGAAMAVPYEVQPGDTLQSIAEGHHTTVEEIRQQNNLTSDTVTPGQQLSIQINFEPSFGLRVHLDVEPKAEK